MPRGGSHHQYEMDHASNDTQYGAKASAQGRQGGGEQGRQQWSGLCRFPDEQPTADIDTCHHRREVADVLAKCSEPNHGEDSA